MTIFSERRASQFGTYNINLVIGMVSSDCLYCLITLCQSVVYGVNKANLNWLFIFS